MRPVRHSLLALALVLVLVCLPTSSTRAADQDAASIATGLSDFSVALDGLATLDTPLTRPIPLSSIPVSDPQALRLRSLFEEGLKARLESYLAADGSSYKFASLDALKSALEAAPSAKQADPGAHLVFRDVALTRLAPPFDRLVDVKLTAEAGRPVLLPLSFRHDKLRLREGKLPATASLSTTLHFQLNTAATASQPRFYLVGAPTLQTTVTSVGPLPAFSSQVGVTRVQVTGDANLDLTILATLVDPDRDGFITQAEWQTTAAHDLYTVQVAPRSAFQGALTLTAPLPPANPSATLTLVDTDLSDGFNPAANPASALGLGPLAVMTNVEGEQLFSGANQVLAALMAIERQANPRLPFLKKGIADLFELSEPLQKFVKQQGEAVILCGTANGNPPSGDISRVGSGQSVFCQAVTTLPHVTNVSWTNIGPVTGAPLGDPTNSSSVGSKPTATVEFKMAQEGRPNVQVSFKAEGTTHVVQTRYFNAQEFGELLKTLGGFQNASVSQPPDRPNRIEFNLQKDFTTTNAGASGKAELDFGTRLQEDTHLTALTSKDSATVASAAVSLNLTFGVILEDNPQAIVTTNPRCTAPDLPSCLENRFYIKTDPNRPELGASAEVTHNLDLDGMLGFLEVTVKSQDGRPMHIGRADPNAPMLGIDVQATKVDVTGAGSIDNAVLVRDVLGDLKNRVRATCNMTMQAPLKVSVEGLGPAPLAGTVDVKWDSVFQPGGCEPNLTGDTGLQIKPDAATFGKDLKPLDTDPSLFGQHKGADPSGVLTVDPGKVPASAKGRQLRNLTDGSSCTIADVTDTTVACTTTGLSGGKTNQWHTGDRYEVVGDPLAMLYNILNSLDTIGARLNGLGVGAFKDPLPLLNVSPKDLVAQLSEVREAVQELRTGTPAAVVKCALLPPDPATTAVKAGCYATSRKPTRGPVQWTVKRMTAGGLVDVTPVENFTDPRTVTTTMTSAISATFTLAPDTGLGAYLVRLQFDDERGRHFAGFPSDLPLSLQRLEKLLETKLGFADNKDVLSFELINTGTQSARAGAPTKDLALRLGYGLCATVEPPPADPAQPTPTPTPRLITCDPSDRRLKAPQTKLNLSAGVGKPGLTGVGVDATGALNVEYAAHVQLNLAVPFSLALEPSAIPDQVAVLPGTGLSVKAAVQTPTADAENVTLQASFGPLKFHVTGKAQVGAQLTLPAAATSRQSIKDYVAGLIQYLTTTKYPLSGLGELTCGTIKQSDQTEVPIKGQACAKLALKAGDDEFPLAFHITNLAEAPDDLTSPERWYFYYPDNLDALLRSSLRWSLLAEALRPYLARLRQYLREGAEDVKIPLLGPALDGGADIVDVLLSGFVEQLGETLEREVGNKAASPPLHPKPLGEAIRRGVFKAFGSLTSADTWVGPRNESDIRVTLYCADESDDCTQDTVRGLDAISNVRLTFYVGEAARVRETDLDIGLPGLPLGLQGKIRPSANWKLLLDFGVDRTLGPYLQTAGPGHGATANADDTDDTTPELTVNASAALDDGHCEGLANPPAGLAGYLDHFDSNRCLKGRLGFLGVTLRDGNNKDGALDTDPPGPDTPSGDTVLDDPTQVKLNTTLNLQGGDNHRLSIGHVGTGLDLDLSVAVTATVNLLLRTEIINPVDSQPVESLPAVVGTFHAKWGWSHGTPQANHKPSYVKFDNLYVDAGKFASTFLRPVVTTIKSVTGPFQPIIDTMKAPLPVLSQLYQLTGRGSGVSLYEMMDLVGDLEMVKRLIGVLDFINHLPTDKADLYIPLSGPGSPGSFNLNPQAMTEGLRAPDQRAALIEAPSGGANVLGDIFNNLRRKSEAGADDEPVTAPAGFSFPIYEDTSRVFNLLLGQDVVLVRFDAGTLQASAGISESFGPIMVGPIPIEITLAGSVGVEGRFVMGYDTSGIRQLIEDGRGEGLADGLFIDDFDSRGVDVPEIKLIGTVSAGAGVTLVIVSAGVEGGISLTVALDLDDPNNDGHMRFYEVVGKLDNPICLFKASGSLDAFLRAYVKVGFSIFSKKWRITIAKVRLLDFSTACEPPKPQLANVEDGNLVLNIGGRADKRKLQEKVTDEKFVVRQISKPGEGSCTEDPDGPKGCTRVSVTAFGYTQEFGVPPAVPPAVPPRGRIVANAGDGDDEISLEDGAIVPPKAPPGTIPTVIPFEIEATIHGDDGNDSIKGGHAGDELYGDDGEDRISGGDGNDSIDGGPADDILSGDAGVDVVKGGDGNDAINGGPDSDILYGDEGDDDLHGGPGCDGRCAQANPPTSDNPPPPQHDDKDILIGGPGKDTLSGDAADDILLGDDLPALAGLSSAECDAAGEFGACYGHLHDERDAARTALDLITAAADTANDQLQGDDGDDTLLGGPGDDQLLGGSGQDYLAGNRDQDTLDGDDDDANTPDDLDWLYGGPGNDNLYGRGGPDLMYGNEDTDNLWGGPDDDHMEGNAGEDYVYGETEDDDIIGGSALAGQPDTRDHLFGGPGRDVMVGDNASIERRVVNGVLTRDVTLYDVGSADPALYGGDQMQGDADDDQMYGQGGRDTMNGNQGADLMYGNADGDWMYGDSGQDTMYGNEGGDEMHGGMDDDYMEGNEDQDTMWGGPGDDHDNMIGGTNQPGKRDTGDEMHGDAGHDVMLGDNGRIEVLAARNLDGSPKRRVTLYDLRSTDPTVYGGDHMWGGAGQDEMFGGRGEDQLRGESDDDYIEGNPDDDLLIGGQGQDDLIGGTSQAELPDGADTLWGGDGVSAADLTEDHDVLLGDNGRIERTVDGSDWRRVSLGLNDGYDASNIVVRTLWLFDVATTSFSPPSDSSGGDWMYGQAGRDLLYGQGGDEKDMSGGAGDDYMEGNAGSDTMRGDAGNDDMVGGTGRINDDGEAGVPGRLDGADPMNGGDGYDVMAGDNALLVRVLDGDHWVANTFNAGIQHRPRLLLDIDSPDAARVSGMDTVNGDGEDDLLYGQGSGDTMNGGDGDDFMEGNAGGDTMNGDAGQDDMIGGTVVAGLGDADDTIHGGDGADVILGDNGTITRPLFLGQWIRQTFTSTTRDVVRRSATLFDVATLGGPTPPATASAGDTLFGDAGRDLLWGQGGADTAHGGADDDYIEGNAGTDTLYGDAGDDDILGGSGPTTSDNPATALDGRLDDKDILYGESDKVEGTAADGGDVMLGDNGLITRPVNLREPNRGRWQVNTYDGTIKRDVALNDIETERNYPLDSHLAGDDTMWGNGNDDIMYGQGGMDTLHGGAGDDFMEGNAASDTMEGDSGEDDMLGGSGPTPGANSVVRHEGRTDKSTASRSVSVESAPVSVSLGDTMNGGPGADVMLGDNGVITRPLENGRWRMLRDYYGLADTDGHSPTSQRADTTAGLRSRVDRVVAMVDNLRRAEGLTAGSDVMRGGPGDDDMYGQLDDAPPSGEGAGGALYGRPDDALANAKDVGDEMYGDEGEDAMAGDLGVFESRRFDQGTDTVGENVLNLDTTGMVQFTLSRVFTMQGGAGGPDRMKGGPGADWMHGGPGNDLMNGEDGNDRLFGAEGNDNLWGGRHHDRLWGGAGDDYLDLVPGAVIASPRDYQEWFDWTDSGSYQDSDIIYGGWGKDVLQSDQEDGTLGRGDRLIDWQNRHNIYFLCPDRRTEESEVIIRTYDLSRFEYILDLGLSDGGDVLHGEIGEVTQSRLSDNDENPTFPNYFACLNP